MLDSCSLGSKKPGAFWEFPFTSEMMVEGVFYIDLESEALVVHGVATGRESYA